ncbi:YhfG family protein [Pantoea sp. 1.19]|uniref:YhfG family protein n=1 Tax=Pantoea sp. 1.19 TaxID=1925589 RepID=UPI00094910FE|nr:YhfG family protein [Pantoea sp. 1.19]
MARTLTDKQKATLWQQRRMHSFQASCRLDGISIVPVTLDDAALPARLMALRRHYER